MNYEKLLTKVDNALSRGEDRAREAVEDYIDAGDLLRSIREDIGSAVEFEELLDKHGSVKRVQANKLIRIATHKEQARRIGGTINSLQSELPTISAPVEETEADTATMAYVGTQPSTEDAPAEPVRNADDWHTPRMYTDLARECMGGIDLDPFSSHQANATVQAERILTEADDAMSCDWASTDTRTVWMNPPYSKGASTKAVDKFLDEYDYGSFEEAVVLMNSSTDTNWFHRMASAASSVCFTKGRISFEDAGGKKSSSNTKGQVFFYFGANPARFRVVFESVGLVFDTGTLS